MQKALKVTSGQITDCLFCKIRDLAQHTSDLVDHVDSLETFVQSNDDELGAVK